MRCTAQQKKAATSWPYRGRFRCPNEASDRVTVRSNSGQQVSVFVLCHEHLPDGEIGAAIPTGWTWASHRLSAEVRS